MNIRDIEEKLRIVVGQDNLSKDATLLDILNDLDQFVKDHPKDTPRDLLHFIHKRSYVKALQFIDNQMDM